MASPQLTLGGAAAAEASQAPGLGAPPVFRPAFFITGGQTGADSIPLSVYERMGVGLRGYLPEGFNRADGCGHAIAERHGLWEGRGGHKWRDKANAGLSDALVAFLSSAPMTGRGTMSTVNVFVNGRHDFAALQQPDDGADFLLIEPEGQQAARDAAERRAGPAEQGLCSTDVQAKGSGAPGRVAGDDGEPRLGGPGGVGRGAAFLYSHENPKHPVVWDPKAKRNNFTRRPVLVFWDLREDRLPAHAAVLRAFLQRHRPENLMFAGPLESTCPGIEALGAALLEHALGEEPECQDSSTSEAATASRSQRRWKKG